MTIKPPYRDSLWRPRPPDVLSTRAPGEGEDRLVSDGDGHLLSVHLDGNGSVGLELQEREQTHQRLHFGPPGEEAGQTLRRGNGHGRDLAGKDVHCVAVIMYRADGTRSVYQGPRTKQGMLDTMRAYYAGE